jgi:hypothetical protein
MGEGGPTPRVGPGEGPATAQTGNAMPHDHLSHRLCLIVSLLSLIAPSTAWATLRPQDRDVINSIDLSRPELATARQAFEADDLESTKAALVSHSRTRESPKWAGLNWASENPERVKRIARSAMLRTFSRAGATHTFPAGKPIDWDFNPTEADTTVVVQNEWTWQLNRHHAWYALALAYGKLKEEKYALAFVDQFRSWVEQCPRPEDSSGNWPKSAWRTIETGIRASGTWPSAFYGFRSSPSFDDDAMMDTLHLFAEHARHLLPEGHFRSGSNWGTMESNGLFTIGVLFPEFKDADLWRETGSNRLHSELEKQVYPDGMQIELSTGYHQVSLRNFYAPLKLARLNDIPMPSGYLERLERMFNFNVYGLRPDNRLPALGDANQTDVRGRMREGVELFPNRGDFLWAATTGKRGHPPVGTSYAFPYSGYLFMRSGWDTQALLACLDVGPFGFGHQHEDKLSLVVSAYGKELITDPGNYHYDRSIYRRHILSAAGHNTVLIDGKGQTRHGEPDRWKYVVDKPLPHVWITEPAHDFAEGVYDEGFGTRKSRLAVHTRRLLFVKSNPESPARTGYWVIHDRLIPKDDKPHTYETLFHLSAEMEDITASPSTSTVFTSSPEANIRIQSAQSDDVGVLAGQKDPMRGWQRARSAAAPLPVASFTSSGVGRHDRVYLLMPIPPGTESPAPTLTVTESDGKLSAEIAFDDGEVHRVGFADQVSASTGRFGTMFSDGRAFWIAVRDNNLLGSFVVDGSVIREE